MTETASLNDPLLKNDTVLDKLIDEADQPVAGVLQAGGESCVTSSFQAECMVLVHLVTRSQPGIPVLFLDTGYHFAETYAYRDQTTASLGLNLVNLLPKQTVAEQAHGPLA